MATPKRLTRQRVLSQAGVAERIHIGVGDAWTTGRPPREFDIIFTDVDKRVLPRVLDLVPTTSRRGGLFITIMSLVWPRDPGRSSGQSYGGNPEFTSACMPWKEFFTTILPLRDGLAVAVMA